MRWNYMKWVSPSKGTEDMGKRGYVVIPWKIAVPVIQAVMVARADAKLLETEGIENTS